MRKRRILYVLGLAIAVGLALVAIYQSNHGWSLSRKTATQERYLVVLSLDGFRPMYAGCGYTPALDKMAEEGVQGELVPAFPSLTFPNHYSMVTGLYPQNHGLVHNRFWAPDLDEYYKVGDKERVQNPDFYFGEPIWNTAEKQGVKAGSFFWVGSETAIQGMRPSYWHEYDGNVSFMARADSVISWLQKPLSERPRLITWYLQEPDGVGHNFGPESPEALACAAEVDATVGYFREQLRQLDIADRVNFIVVSDHGMAQLDSTKYINLVRYLPLDKFYFIAEGAPTMLYTKDKSYVDEAMGILATIPNITAYRRGEVPARFNFSTSDRIGDIVVIPDVGVQLQFRAEDPSFGLGAHGFDNQAPEMRSIFYAVGPDFPQGVKAKAVPNITLYPLMCRLLCIEPAPNDASEGDVDVLLGR